jgi:hypothetical protein
MAQGDRLWRCKMSAAIWGTPVVALTHSGRQFVTQGGHLSSALLVWLVKRRYWHSAVQLRGLAFVIATRFLKYALILGLLPTDILAQPELDSGARCTHLVGLDEIYRVHKPMAAGPDAIQNARKIYVDRFENQLPDGVALTWVNTEGNSIPASQNVIIQIVQGTLHVTCGNSF